MSPNMLKIKLISLLLPIKFAFNIWNFKFSIENMVSKDFRGFVGAGTTNFGSLGRNL